MEYNLDDEETLETFHENSIRLNDFFNCVLLFIIITLIMTLITYMIININDS